MSDLKSLYQEVIIDHSKRPRNFKMLDDYDLTAVGHNPLCGDNLKVFVKMRDNLIEDVSFVGDGCAISKASASLMTEIVKGKNIAEFTQIFQDFHQLVTSEQPNLADLGKLRALLGVRDYPARVKCATLAWHTLDAALNNKNHAKTE